MYSSLKLLGIFAHPDDESLTCGGTFARYAKEDILLSSPWEYGKTGGCQNVE